ncbi:hypothetical protein [Janthinobacterium sp. SUN100]|uniref:hypothetical protein n=1 Tax=Janthinobacterium sp. SUN100 TaxID=3004101 RepID=UPI00339D62A6
MTNEDEVDDERTTRRAPLNGTVVSRRRVADLIANIIAAPDLHLRESGREQTAHRRGQAVFHAASSSAAAQHQQQRRAEGENRICDWGTGKMEVFSNPSITSHNLYYVK